MLHVPEKGESGGNVPLDEENAYAVAFMQESVMDALDLRLINALQIQPRASWSALGGSSAWTQ